MEGHSRDFEFVQIPAQQLWSGSGNIIRNYNIMNLSVRMKILYHTSGTHEKRENSTEEERVTV